MTHLARIAARVFNTPLLVLPETALTIANVLFDRVGVDAFAEDEIALEASRFRGTPRGPQRSDGSQANYYRVEGGVAIIPILGELVNRGAWIGASSGLVSYEGLDAQLRAAAADASIRGIVLDMNTPGGEAFGAFETSALVRKVAADKPVVAFVNGMAASAGYAIACGASRIVTIPSGVVGSIGVIMMHMDRSAALAKAGLKPTIIHAGAHKADMSSLRELPDDARGRLQAYVDDSYALFVSTVATNRKLSPEAVRATEGGIIMGSAAVEAGFADATGTIDDAIAFINRSQPGASITLGTAMTDVAKADHDAALAKAQSDGFATGLAAGIQGERERVGAILGLEEAKGREATARHLALSSDMSAEAAKGFLLTVPVAAAPAAVAPPSRLSRTPNPPIAPDAIGAEGRKDASTGWDDIVAGLNADRGFKTR